MQQDDREKAVEEMARVISDYWYEDVRNGDVLIRRDQYNGAARYKADKAIAALEALNWRHIPEGHVVVPEEMRNAAIRISSTLHEATGRMTPDYSEVSGPQFQMMCMDVDPDGLAEAINVLAASKEEKP